ncbi:MAG: extracellular solute-binding protein [Gaiellales bacterium]
MGSARMRSLHRPFVMLTTIAVVAAVAVGATRAAGAARADEKKLVVWDYGARPNTSKAYDRIYAAFMKTHPGVEIERRSFSGGDDFQAAFQPAMAANKGPDIWAGGVTEQLLNNGLVLELTPYYCRYGWNKTLNSAQVRLTQRRGKIWQIPDSIESNVVFYNKDVFRRIGATEPKTWAQFLGIVKKAKAKGVVPVGFGNVDKFGGGAFWHGALIGNSIGAKAEQAILFGNGRWDSPGVVAALEKWVQLVGAGAFPDASVSISFDEGLSLFARKKAAMFLTGSYVLTELSGASIFTNPNTGVFLLPSWNAKVGTNATDQSGNNWVANARTKDPALAAELLNHLLFKPASQKILVEETNDVLAVKGLSRFKLSPQLKRIRTLVDAMPPGRISYSYLSSLVPGEVQQAFFDDMQGLQAGKEKPAEVAAKWQKLWAEAKAKGQTLKPGAPPKCGK